MLILVQKVAKLIMIFIAAGVLLNAYSTDFWILLLASGVFLGPAQSLMDVTSMTAVYHYFRSVELYHILQLLSV